MANTVAGLSPVIAPVYSPIANRKSISFYKPHLLSYKHSPIPSRKFPKDSSLCCFSSPRTARVIEVARKQRNRSCSVFGSLTDEEESNGYSEGQVASVDLKLPRRSLLVEFSCNSCGERTKRLINRLAYERGLVFVQCGGCLKHHKLVDNLGLIVEYDFRLETSKDLGLDQV